MTKINIVLFWYMNDWGLYGRTYENIATGLAEHPQVNKVICVLPPHRKAVGDFAFQLQKPQPNLFIVTPNPRCLNSTGSLYRARQWLNNKISPLAAIKYFLKSLGLRKSNTILWLFPHHPIIDKLLEAIPHSLLITQIVDNVLNKTDLDEATKQLVTEQYARLPAVSDITITSSLLNFSIFKENAEHCYLLENGLDQAFISPPTPLPNAANNARPRLGYLGFISERTDLQLLKQLAIARPEYDIIIAGPDNKPLLPSSDLLTLPNVSHIDYIPYTDAPQFLRTLDVCLIPHIDSPFSQSMSPLKLFQYLATGRPIISTEVAGTERWQELVYIADGADDFISKIDASFSEDSSLPSKRIAAASEETWPHRIDRLLTIINGHRP